MGTRVEKKELGMLHKAVLLESGKWLLLTTKGFEVYIREGSATVGCRKGSTLELKIIHCSLLWSIYEAIQSSKFPDVQGEIALEGQVATICNFGQGQRPLGKAPGDGGEMPKALKFHHH